MRAVTISLLALLLLIAGSSAPADETKTPLHTQVVTREMIQQAGLTRLADILLLAEGWDLTTIEGFTWQASARGLSPFERQAWEVMVDGQRVDIDEFGGKSLNRLPISLDDIDHVEFISVPQLHAGEFVDGGMIHIHLKAPDEGLSVRGRVVTGSETGDPGPFLYSGEFVPNVERFGHEASFSASYGADRAFVQARLSIARHYAGDELIIERYESISDDDPRVLDLVAPAIRVGFGSRRSQHEVFAGFSGLSDGFFLKPYGREIPVDNRHSQIGIQGGFSLGDNQRLTYRVAHFVNDFDERPNVFDLDPDWQRSRTRARLVAARHTPVATATVGIGLDRIKVDTGYDLTEKSDNLGELNGELDYRLTGALKQMLAASLLVGGDDLGFKALFGQQLRLGATSSLEGVYAYSERLPEEESTIWLWSERGYRFLQENGVDVAVDGPIDPARRHSVDLLWRTRPHPLVSLELGGFFRSYSDLHLERQRFEFNPTDDSFASPVGLLVDQGGDVAGGEVTIEPALPAKMSLRLYYRYLHSPSGDSTFRGLWDEIPRHQILSTFSYSPVKGLTLWALLRYRDATEWTDYRDIGQQTGGVYSSAVPRVVNIDVAIERLFWKERIRGGLAFRNILDQDLQYHPIGAESNLTLVAQAAIVLRR
jgi:hypothetical protein